MLPLALVLTITLLGCGGAASEIPPTPDLVEGEGLYALRLNPPPCLRGQPAFHVELQTPAGWERVALAEGGETPLQAALLKRLGEATGVVRMRAVVSDEVRSYGAGHHARVVRLLAFEEPD